MPLLSRSWNLIRQPHKIRTRLVERRMRLAAHEFYRQRTPAENDAERLAAFAPAADVSAFVEEARQLPIYQQLSRDTNSTDSDLQIAASQTTSLDDCVTMYVLVRLWQPRLMVETGVFYGAMSAMILSAMARNGGGTLYSIDLPLEADGLKPELRGGLVPDELRENWHLILGDARIQLPPLLERLKQIDAFNHDSLHTTAHMTWEFESAWQYVKPGGFLSSHDVLTTPSWEQFRKRHAAQTDLAGRVYGLGFAHKRS